jgi:two-component system NtrC family sensor kinase
LYASPAGPPSERLYQALQEVLDLVSSNFDFNQVLDAVLEHVAHILPYTSASIHFLRGDYLYYSAGRGFPVDSHPESELSAGENAIFQHIAQTRQAMLLRDVREHPDWHFKPGLEYIRSWIGAPLVAKGQVIGYLTLDHHETGAYDREDVQIAGTLARQVAVVIENARLHSETRRWAEEQAALNTIATAASSSLRLKKMLTHVLDAVRMLFEVDAAEVRLLNGNEGTLSVTARRPPDPAIPGAAGDAAAPDRTPSGPGDSVAAVTLRSKERLLGSLSVISHRPRQFTPRETALLEAISYQVSLAIENARLYEELKESEARKTALLDELEMSLQELQHAQAKLVQSEKLAAIGQLVSGVAHELNNPLTAIIGYSQMLQMGDLPEPVQDDLERIIEQAQRSARIVQKLLTFGRQDKPERRPVDVNQLIVDTLDLVSYQLAMDGIHVERSFARDLPLALADRFQLQQVWLNLIQNAQQAMYATRGKGVLRIRTRATRRRDIRVEFKDDGPGIPPSIMEKIFDPFFTTKPVGQGTGLGLSICYGIVQEHQGEIWAENNAGRGSTFVVVLPGHAGFAWETPPAPSPLV